MSNAELATSYAALILADDGVEITVRPLLFRDLRTWLELLCGKFADCTQADKLQTLIKAAKIDDVEPIWTSLFAKVRRTLQWR